ncbi:MAG: glycosyltransferase family 2 protein [Dysgonamonadaceae bacterium]|jgi:glycosyltransferase involved in cell wall biosynthesis|nr:glycosyltransferase family 2 protein [Dysgonamonadaceae bacterium]
MQETFLSILIPVYNESECLLLLHERLSEVIRQLDCDVEILFVNDGSSDNSLEMIEELQNADGRISYLDLSRNFGKEIAMRAGIDYIKGNALLIMDADLQDPPELIPLMLKEIKNGYDDVYACRSARNGETFLKKATSRGYYRLLKYVSMIDIQENTGDFRMFGSQAICALRELKENELNMKYLFSHIGFRKKPIYYERHERIAGKTKWNYLKLLNLAIKGFTSSSTLPLRFISLTGCTVSLVAFIYLIIIVIKSLIHGDPVTGYPSLMSVLLFLGGLILLSLGIIGEYLGIIFNETKKRPVWFVKKYKSATQIKI